MLKTGRVLLILILIAGTVLLSYSLHQKPKNDASITLMATVYPLMEFAREVAGERGTVNLLLPPGADVHTWQPRVSDIMKFNSLDVLIYIGMDLEPWLGDILRSVSRPGLKIIEASRGLELIAGSGEGEGHHEDHRDHGAFDPHVWLDLSYDMFIVDRIREILIELSPENADYFTENASKYKTKLRNLDQKFRDTFKDCRHKTFILGGHAAFAYLARRYGLHQIALYGLSPDSEPTPRHLGEVIALARKLGIKTVFFEKNVSQKMSRLLAKEIGARVLPLNAGANLSEEQWKSKVTFIDIMEENLKNLKHGLLCQ